MAGKNPAEAYRNFQDSLYKALGCITAGRLTVPRGPRFQTDHENTIALSRGDGVALGGDHRLLFTVLQNFTILETEDPECGPFKVRTKSYFFHIATQSRVELFAYHWEPETSPGRPFPYRHIGLASINPGHQRIKRRTLNFADNGDCPQRRGFHKQIVTSTGVKKTLSQQSS